MNVVHDFVRVSLPSYFKSIPIPKDFSGFGDLSWQEILRLVAFIVLFGLIVYSVFRSLVGSSPASNSTPKQEPEDSGEEKDQGNSDPDEDRVVNLKVEKDKEKVVTTRDMEDLGDQAVFCRCWRSSKVCTQVLSYGPRDTNFYSVV